MLLAQGCYLVAVHAALNVDCGARDGSIPVYWLRDWQRKCVCQHQSGCHQMTAEVVVLPVQAVADALCQADIGWLLLFCCQRWEREQASVCICDLQAVQLHDDLCCSDAHVMRQGEQTGQRLQVDAQPMTVGAAGEVAQA